MAQAEFLRFEPGRPEGDTLLAWWRDLQGHQEEAVEESGAPGRPTARPNAPNYRGARAELRRCAELTGVVLTPAYQRLYYALRNLEGVRPPYEERLATVAGVLAHVDEDTAQGGRTFARQLAQPRGDQPGSAPVVSELRFRRLLRIQDHAELYPMLLRLVRLLDSQADVFSLAQGAYGWGDAQRKRWAYDYYDAVFRQGGTGAGAE